MDSTTWLETTNSTTALQKRAIKELVLGREWAYRLQIMMLSTTTATPTTTNTSSLSADHQRRRQDDLVAKILGSFTAAISLLNSADADKPSQVPEAPSDLPSSHHLKPCQDTTLSDGKPSATSKHPRGSYKRRKTSETWLRESPTLVDDGHAWRKYGQKVILNAEYPRNYFRCTHKLDQGCQATKQVQKIQEEPTVFRTTYHGRHTCKTPIVLQQEAPQIIHLDAAAAAAASNARDSSALLSFESTQVHQPNMSNESFTAAGLPQVKEEVVHGLLQIQPSSTMSSSSNHRLLPSDFKTFETSALSSGSDHGDVMSSGVYSCSTASPHSHGNSMDMEMDMMVGSMVNDFDYFSEFEFDT